MEPPYTILQTTQNQVGCYQLTVLYLNDSRPNEHKLLRDFLNASQRCLMLSAFCSANVTFSRARPNRS